MKMAMLKSFGLTVLLAVALAGTSAQAEEYEVKMLNKGEKGMMVFEPELLKVAPGDTVRFVPTNPGHNVESIKGMIPDGAEPFAGKVGKEFVVTFTQPGIYGVECKPHYVMGMVAAVVVGEPVNLEAAKAVKQPGKAKQRFGEIFDGL
jgi:pseudoazurin